MNMHVPQSTLAAAEAKHIMFTSNHIVTPQTNSPVAGNVQDALVGIYMITNTWDDGTETMIDSHVVYNCYYASNIDTNRMIDMFKRAERYYPEYVKDGYIIREKLDTGRTIAKAIPGKLFASILFPENFIYYKKTDTNETHHTVRIEKGIILPDSAPICKKIVGAKSGTIGHILWKEYGQNRAMKLHGEVEWLVYNWLPTHGFSMGISDCINNDKETVRNALADATAEVEAIYASVVEEDRREAKISNVLNSVMNIGPTLAKNGMNKGDKNSLNIMRNSGAKGSLINCSQIIAFVGQQNIDGTRVHCDLSGGTRALPHFEKNDSNPEARGMIYNNYYEGLSPAEVFFHAAAGRRGITDTSIKTATTGYIQKRIARLLEDIKSCIDGTVRSANGNIIEFMYGDDGMNPKRLYSVKGINHPFFINPINLARRLSINSSEIRREMTLEETDVLVSFIKSGIPGIQNLITEITTDNICKVLRKVLVGVEIAEDKIPEFCREIKDEFEISKIEPGEMVGLVATHAIGSPCTQLSVTGDTAIMAVIKTITGDEYYQGEIGSFIDNILSKTKITNLGGDSVVATPDDDIFIMTVNPKTETTEWNKLSEVSRHPANGGMVKITTRSGRTVTTTLSHSHLKRTSEGTIVPIEGKDLKEGDRVPVNRKMPRFGEIIKTMKIGTKSITLDFDLGMISGEYVSRGYAIYESDNDNSDIDDFIDLYYNDSPLPAWIHCATDEYITGFLRGYLDRSCDYSDRIIKIKATSENREQLLLLLSRFEIFGTFDGFNIIIFSNYANILLEKIGTKISKNIDNLRKIAKFIIPEKDDLDKIPHMDSLIFDTANKLGINTLPICNRFKKPISRKTLVGFYKLFETESIKRSKDVSENLKLLKQAIDSHIVWDVITKIEYLDDPDDYVYDFGVENNHTFMIRNGLYVHNTLNSVEWNEEFSVQQEGKTTKHVKIGEWIDELLEANPEKIVHIENNRTEYLELDSKMYVTSLDLQGNTSWEVVSAITRHLPVGELVKITTRSGRSVTATQAKSFLIWDVESEKFVPSLGEHIKVGDLVPSTFNLAPPPTIIDTLDVSTYLPKTEWIYSADLLLANRMRNEVGIPTPNNWYKNNHGISFTLPYSRSDSVWNAIKKNTFVDNCIYPKFPIRVVSKIPANIPLTEEFGFFVGIYLADGWCTDTFMGISNHDEIIRDKIKNLCDKYGITYHTVESTNPRFPGSKSIDLKIHSVTIARLFKKWTGTGSSNKKVPDETFSAPNCFIKGLLDGYFSGDGTVNKRDLYIVASSASEKLLLGISSLCTYFGIFGKLSSHQLDYNNIGSKNIKRTYTFSIRNINATIFSKEIGSSHTGKNELLKMITSMSEGNIYKKIKDIMLDPVVSVEYVTSDHECVYDLTVPTTLNFSLSNGLGMRDTFHSIGNSEVDITMGVPRIDELLRASKSTSTPTCTVHVNDIRLNQNAKNIQLLEKKNIALSDSSEDYKKNYTKAQELKLSSYGIIQDFCTNLEQISIEKVLTRYEIKYIDNSFPGGVPFDWKLHASPTNIVTYKEYEEPWWVSLKRELYGEFDIESNKWVICLEFDKSKLFKYSINLEEIADKITENTNGNLCCAVSPENISQIEIYMNFSDINDHLQTLINLPPGSSVHEFLTTDNADFFAARDVAIVMVKDIILRGVSGISRVYPREDKKTKEWVIDTKGSNIVDILSLPGVNIISTTSNDLYQIYNTMGIEAARNFLYREINAVLGAYGIYINSRHIQLLIDRMTWSGELSAVTEKGIGREAGPVAKLAFERPMDNVVVSAMFTENDNINGVAASIMFGKFVNAGTGTVEIVPDEQII